MPKARRKDQNNLTEIMCKLTLLSALAGNVTCCTMSSSIHINGGEESMNSNKKNRQPYTSMSLHFELEFLAVLILVSDFQHDLMTCIVQRSGQC